MKLIRHGDKGQEKPGLLDSEGNFRDLSSIINDIDGHSLSSDSLALISQVDISTLPLLDHGTRLGACVGNIGKTRVYRSELLRPCKRIWHGDTDRTDRIYESD